MPYNVTIQRKVGSAGELLPIWTGNVTTGVGIANIVASTVGFAWYRNDMATASTGTCTSGTLGSFSASSWVQALSTGMLGWYNFGIPPGVFASGNSAAIRLSSATMPEVNVFIELTKTDNQTFMSSQTLSTNALVNVNLVLGSTPVTSVAGMFSVNVSTIHAQAAVTSAPGIFSVNVSTLHAQTAVTSAPGIFSANLTTVLGSNAVTTAAGVLATTWDLSRTANLTSTIALTATTISTNQLVNVNQILGSAPVTNAAGVLEANLKTIYGTAPVTTAAGILATVFDLGRTANLTSTISLTGTALSTNQFVNVNQILGSTPVTSAAGTLKADLATIYGTAPVTTSAGKLSVGITGTQTYDITGSLSGSVGSVTGSVASVTGLNAALLDVSVSSRLSAAGYTAPLSAADTRGAVGLASANLDTQLGTLATTTQAAAIQAKTDSLTFTTTGLVDANLKAIRERALTGDGSGTPFDVV